MLVRDQLHYRRDAFETGLRRLGYKIAGANEVSRGGHGDALVTWNRYGANHRAATELASRGGIVLVTENNYLGDDLPGEKQYALSRDHHNGAGWWIEDGPERWDRLGIELKPWRKDGGETVVLPQRGIGEPGVAMPLAWAREAKRYGRVRPHVHGKANARPLADDLRKASAVVTWGSGAAIRALVWGIPVFHAMPRWISAQAARHVGLMDQGRMCDDAARLAMFRRLAWAMAPLSEIESGEAIDRLRGA